jgi:N-glycosylase/DNA lyase
MVAFVTEMTGRINVSDFDLAVTLECGQAFRWRRDADSWFVGVVGNRVMRLRQTGGTLEGDVERHYLALDVSLRKIVATFPPNPTLREAVNRHWGLRVLRQEPWETLASFIASSTKQIVQIRQIVELLAQRLGNPIDGNHVAFPSAEAVARATLPELLACKLGFRAQYLLAAARAVDAGRLDLGALPNMERARSEEELMKLDGVGEKIANCVLLFSCGHDEAFPVDVWMKRALRRVKQRKHLGPYAGWAQQYLFHFERNLSSGLVFNPSSEQKPTNQRKKLCVKS